MRGANRLTSNRQPLRAKARWYRDFARSGVIVACVGLAMLVSGCDTTDSRYFRYGIGTDLYSDDIVQTTQFQDIYLTELCRQALPVLSTSDGQCLSATIAPNDWNLLVQAGLNDVDRRCDSYLAWLDDRRRTNNAVLKELGDVTVASQAIMNVAGVSANPITLVGLAFGLAANTFTNVNSRLLLEVDKTTVQTLVLRRRDDFRLGLQSIRIENRPAAVHALRSYLNICTPFTIETDINSTITVFQQAGSSALDRKGPLVSAVTVGTRIAAVAPTARTPVNAGKIISDSPKILDVYKSYLEAFDPKVHSSTYVEGVLSALCVPVADYSSVLKVKALIGAYEAGIHQGSSRARANGLLDDNEMRALTRMGPCPKDFRNAYERTTFPTATAQGLAKPLSSVSGIGPIPETTPLRDLRGKIILARKALKMEDSQIPDQITPDFFDKLDSQ